MEYKIETLLPIVAKLTDKYTSKESSSITYETAEMLMNAVIYCINECLSEEKADIISYENEANVEIIYENVYKIVIEKVFEAKELYEILIENFEDYGCKNYRDTILKGIPEFFIRFDAKFNPMNHILTLDYPLISGNPNLSGIDLILEYLKGIKLEKEFMDSFDQQIIIALLDKNYIDYQSLYFDNLCYPILMNTIGCIIVEKPIGQMKLNNTDYKDIKFYFDGDDVSKVEHKIKTIIQMIAKQIRSEDIGEYFNMITSDYSVRILNGIQKNSLENVIVSL